MDVDINFIITNIIKNIDFYLKDENLTFEIISFNEYVEKTIIFKRPDKYFENIGKKLIHKIKKYIDDIYNINFIKKNNIIEETIISFSFECLYIDIEKLIKSIKFIIHIFQYNNENCILKLIPLFNITSKSIYINIKKNIEELNYITNKIENLNIQNQCTYFPKSGKNKGTRCKNDVNGETININNILCNKHKRFIKIRKY